jgi:hypothetical protein
MSIALKCKCGRHMKVKNSKSGKKVRCPNCGEGVRVPVLNPKTDDQIKALKDWVKDIDKSQRDAGRAAPSAATKSSRSHTATPPPQNKVQENKPPVATEAKPFPWLYVGALAGVLVLGGLIWRIWLR